MKGDVDPPFFDSFFPPLLVSKGSAEWLPPLDFFSRPRRLARPRTSPFHGGNTGSNPVGDANLTKLKHHIDKRID
jgi:hypothetical protein